MQQTKLYLIEDENEIVIWHSKMKKKGAPSGESGAYGPAKMTITDVTAT